MNELVDLGGAFLCGQISIKKMIIKFCNVNYAAMDVPNENVHVVYVNCCDTNYINFIMTSNGVSWSYSTIAIKEKAFECRVCGIILFVQQQIDLMDNLIHLGGVSAVAKYLFNQYREL